MIFKPYTQAVNPKSAPNPAEARAGAVALAASMPPTAYRVHNQTTRVQDSTDQDVGFRNLGSDLGTWRVAALGFAIEGRVEIWHWGLRSGFDD